MSESNNSEVIQLSRNPIKLLIWGLIASLLIWIALHIATTVLVFSLAGLIAYLVSSPIKGLARLNLLGTKRKIPWGLATLIVYLLLVGALTLLVFITIPIMMEEVNLLTSSTPHYFENLENQLRQLQAWYHKLGIPLALQQQIHKYAQSLLAKTEPEFTMLAKNVATGILKLFSAVLVFVGALVFSLYIILDEKKIKQHTYDMFPASWRKDTEELFRNMGQVVGKYVRGQLILCVIIGSASYLVLLILDGLGLHYDYRLLTALSVAVLYPIPFLGVWLPRLAAPLLAYLQTGQWPAALWMFAALSGVGVVIDNAVLPIVLGKGIGISPLMVLFVIFAGGELFGIWGLVLSIPAAAVIRLIFFYIQKHVVI